MRTLLVTLGALVLASSVASAAGPVRVSLAGSRPAPTLGQPWTATLAVRPGSYRGMVRVTATGPARLVARASRVRGSYRARLVFPAVGRWTLTARAGRTTSRLGSVTVRRPPALRFAWPTSVAVQSDGSLLVVENGRGRVVVVQPTAGRTRELASRLAKPYAAVPSPSGDVYVSDGPSLKRLGAGGVAETLATADADVGPLAVAPGGDVFYTSGSRLFRLAGSGGAPQTVLTGLSNPHGLAVAADGSLLVSDTGNDRVLRAEPGSGALSTVIRTGQPRGIDVAADGRIYLVEAVAKRVGLYGADGARLGDVGPVFGDPYDVAAGAGGTVFVVDTSASGVIRRVSANGTTVTVPTG